MQSTDTISRNRATGSPRTWTRRSLVVGVMMAGISIVLLVAVIVLQMFAALGWVIGQGSLHPWTDVLGRICVATALIAALPLLVVTPVLAVVRTLRGS